MLAGIFSKNRRTALDERVDARVQAMQEAVAQTQETGSQVIMLVGELLAENQKLRCEAARRKRNRSAKH